MLPADARIVALPWSQHFSHRPEVDYLATRLGRSFFGGYQSTMPPAFSDLAAATDAFPAPPALATVRALGATHVLIDQSRVSPGHRRALAVAEHGWWSLVSRPIAGPLWLTCTLLLVAPPLVRRWRGTPSRDPAS